MRERAFGEKTKGAGVVLIGDYNLVGSNKPLKVLKNAGLTDLLVKGSDGAAYTWRGLKPVESFWPGRLDLVTHDSKLKPLKGVVLDTARLSPARIARTEGR